MREWIRLNSFMVVQAWSRDGDGAGEGGEGKDMAESLWLRRLREENINGKGCFLTRTGDHRLLFFSPAQQAFKLPNFP